MLIVMKKAGKAPEKIKTETSPFFVNGIIGDLLKVIDFGDGIELISSPNGKTSGKSHNFDFGNNGAVYGTVLFIARKGDGCKDLNEKQLGIIRACFPKGLYKARPYIRKESDQRAYEVEKALSTAYLSQRSQNTSAEDNRELIKAEELARDIGLPLEYCNSSSNTEQSEVVESAPTKKASKRKSTKKNPKAKQEKPSEDVTIAKKLEEKTMDLEAITNSFEKDIRESSEKRRDLLKESVESLEESLESFDRLLERKAIEVDDTNEVSEEYLEDHQLSYEYSENTNDRHSEKQEITVADQVMSFDKYKECMAKSKAMLSDYLTETACAPYSEEVGKGIKEIILSKHMEKVLADSDYSKKMIAIAEKDLPENVKSRFFHNVIYEFLQDEEIWNEIKNLTSK